MTEWLPGVHAAPNIQSDQALYEVENRALDPEGKLFEAMRRITDWSDRVVLDLGAGSGFWLPHFHTDCRHVFAVEPHGRSRVLACGRVAALGLDRASVLAGSAERIFLPDNSVDFVHARFAYFWGPGCEPGLAEVQRVLCPGGSVFIIDNDLRRGTFADWLRRAPSAYQRDPDKIDAFWKSQGFSCTEVMSEWRFDSRDDLRKVLHLEFPAEHATTYFSEHEGHTVDYGYNIYYRKGWSA